MLRHGLSFYHAISSTLEPEITQNKNASERSIEALVIAWNVFLQLRRTNLRICMASFLRVRLMNSTIFIPVAHVRKLEETQAE